jgi:hypothetical protein
MAARKKAKRKATRRNTKSRATARRTSKRRVTKRRAKSVPQAIVTGTVEALTDFAARIAEIPGLVIKRVGF